MNFMEEYFFFF